MRAADVFATFAVEARVPAPALHVAVNAVLDTVGVTLAGSVEPAARAVQRTAAAEGGAAACVILGTAQRSGACWAALANGTAAHALDFDDVSFVSLGHPSAPLVGATLAAGDLVHASGRALLEAFVVGFEVESALGRTLNPDHYRHGWHSTSTIGTLGTAAAVARLLSLDAEAAARCLAIAASEASGLKENFGTMTKPLHAGLAARNGVLAALLAREGLTASAAALDGAQGFFTVLNGARPGLGPAAADLGVRWDILESGLSVKLYPSCAGTHPALDVLLDMRRQEGLGGADVEAVDIAVDAITPTVLIHDRPATGLEAKFSMPYCAAAALARGRVGIETFEAAALADEAIRQVMERVTMRVDPQVGKDAPPLTQNVVTVRLRDGRTLQARANGARGYPDRPPRPEDLDAKFRAAAARALSASAVEAALERLHGLESLADVTELTQELSGFGGQSSVGQ